MRGAFCYTNLMKSKFSTIFVAILAVCLAIFLIFKAHTASGQLSAIQIGSATLDKIEIADIPAKQEQGLSGRTSIDADYGMLFIFEKPGFYAFWMKDMNFPIDMIWLDQSGKIVGLAESVLPSSYPKTFEPEAPATYVLEVQSGLAQKEGLKIGDSVKFIR